MYLERKALESLSLVGNKIETKWLLNTPNSLSMVGIRRWLDCKYCMQFHRIKFVDLRSKTSELSPGSSDQPKNLGWLSHTYRATTTQIIRHHWLATSILTRIVSNESTFRTPSDISGSGVDAYLTCHYDTFLFPTRDWEPSFRNIRFSEICVEERAVH